MTIPIVPADLTAKGLEDILVDFAKCWDLAQRMDAMYPNLPKSFTGTPSERLNRVFDHMITLIEGE